MEIRPSKSLSGLKLNDVKPREEQKDVPKAPPELKQLTSSVDNNKEAAQDIKKIAEPTRNAEVEQAVIEASGAKIRDVEQASDLANKLSRDIKASPDRALEAQKDPRASVVQSLLG